MLLQQTGEQSYAGQTEVYLVTLVRDGGLWFYSVLNEETRRVVRGAKSTPAAALGDAQSFIGGRDLRLPEMPFRQQAPGDGTALACS